MAEKPDELKKMIAIGTDMDLAPDLRKKALETLGRIGTHEALVALLEVVANDNLNRGERELALKYAGQIVKTGK